MRLRRGIALEKDDDRRDRLREEQRRGGSGRVDRSRVTVRARRVSTDWDFYSRDSCELCEPVLSHDGQYLLRYSRHDRSRGGGARRQGFQARRSDSRFRSHGRLDDTGYREVLKRRYKKPEASIPLAADGVAELPSPDYYSKPRQQQQVKQVTIPPQQPQELHVADMLKQQHDPIGTTIHKQENQVNVLSHQQQELQATDPPNQQHVLNGIGTHKLVSFYFTNVPDNISHNSLRKGFEVCGIMEDVYLARKRNVNGALFGFVRYSKVKDISKLLKAVNNVWFGDWKVEAKVSNFDRFGNKRDEVRERGEGEKIIEGVKSKVEVVKSVGGGAVNNRWKGGYFNGGIPVVEGVSVGVGREMEEGGKASNLEVQPKRVFIPKYRFNINDVSWASKGMVVSVLNGEAIPVL